MGLLCFGFKNLSRKFTVLSFSMLMLRLNCWVLVAFWIVYLICRYNCVRKRDDIIEYQEHGVGHNRKCKNWNLTWLMLVNIWLRYLTWTSNLIQKLEKRKILRILDICMWPSRTKIGGIFLVSWVLEGNKVGIFLSFLHCYSFIVVRQGRWFEHWCEDLICLFMRALVCLGLLRPRFLA